MRVSPLYPIILACVLVFTACTPEPQAGGDQAGTSGEAASQDGPAVQSSASDAGTEGPQGTQAQDEAAATSDTDGAALTVLFLGDSITAGYGLDPNQAFPALLQARADSLGQDVTMINGGSSGETSAGGLRRIDWILRTVPDVFVLELGGNDGLRGIDVTSTQENLQAIIDQTRARNPAVEVIVAGMMLPPNFGQEYTTAFAGMYPVLAQANDASLIPFVLEGVGGVDSLMLPDQIHPNAAGHRAVADLIAPYVDAAIDRAREGQAAD